MSQLLGSLGDRIYLFLFIYLFIYFFFFFFFEIAFERFRWFLLAEFVIMHIAELDVMSFAVDDNPTIGNVFKIPEGDLMSDLNIEEHAYLCIQ